MNPILSKSETDSMRGVAILFIMLHNLLHWKVNTIENEYTFVLDRSQLFMEQFKEFNGSLWQDICSFLGWYGVAVFLFLSGYGLARKYGFTQSPNFSPRHFVWRHIKSVFLLMILPYIPFAMMQVYYNDAWLQVFLQTTLLANIFSPHHIDPGVYWFFGLIIQFYLIYALLNQPKIARHRGGVILIIINILAIIWLFLLKNNTSMLSYLRHNFIGWLLPFSMGIWFAQKNVWHRAFNAHWKNALWIIIGGGLVTLSNLNYHAWIISPLFAIMAAIGLTKIITLNRALNNCLIWTGALSAFLFAIHPAIRFLCLKVCWDEMTRLPYILGYLFISFVVAFFYRKIHHLLFNRWLS